MASIGGVAAAAAHGRRAGRRAISAGERNVQRAHELARGLEPADIGRIIGVSRATVYGYLNLDADG
jgi:DNA-binding CsgD family transcriptional regulator